ncbi:MAG TPA: hypothetical protein VNT42_03245 [Sphingomonas sp.]|nr:hypothetical protein [Sphingomonas sp.]
MNPNVAALIENGKAVSIGMAKVAAAKPNDHPLQSNAKSFRGAAQIISALTMELARADERASQLTDKLRRIANLQVRHAPEAIQSGDWKAIVAELQVVAQEGLTPGTNERSPRGPRIPRRPPAIG